MYGIVRVNRPAVLVNGYAAVDIKQPRRLYEGEGGGLR